MTDDLKGKERNIAIFCLVIWAVTVGVLVLLKLDGSTYGAIGFLVVAVSTGIGLVALLVLSARKSYLLSLISLYVGLGAMVLTGASTARDLSVMPGAYTVVLLGGWFLLLLVCTALFFRGGGVFERKRRLRVSPPDVAVQSDPSNRDDADDGSNQKY